jgi:hypothetical protein
LKKRAGAAGWIQLKCKPDAKSLQVGRARTNAELGRAIEAHFTNMLCESRLLLCDFGTERTREKREQ